MKQNKDIVNRRAFLKAVWKYAGALALFEAVVMSVSLLRARSSRTDTLNRNLKEVGKLSDIPPGTMMPFRTGRFFLVRLDDGDLMAISMVCSHLGCTVNWDAADNVFKCPCHSSAFDMYGNVIKSPATKALNYYKVLVRDGMVMVDLDNPMARQKFDPSVLTHV